MLPLTLGSPRLGKKKQVRSSGMMRILSKMSGPHGWVTDQGNSYENCLGSLARTGPACLVWGWGAGLQGSLGALPGRAGSLAHSKRPLPAGQHWASAAWTLPVEGMCLCHKFPQRRRDHGRREIPGLHFSCCSCGLKPLDLARLPREGFYKAYCPGLRLRHRALPPPGLLPLDEQI